MGIFEEAGEEGQDSVYSEVIPFDESLYLQDNLEDFGLGGGQYSLPTMPVDLENYGQDQVWKETFQRLEFNELPFKYF